ncbi:MAG: hypothetical protein ACTMUB_09085 [cyanobacterium endosymbiont of Rhopalodia musculus]|uniref:hypothetical protein n=1 Tax=cyanobacterium endosymbiont of Epithemia clementina EcSB TaxID=3034674 RepID=UPI002480FEF0|nr:hypothetical protein [cyanobacterium endosymbiont of Epithemia clementina EcSB]WGT68209.1 hypothetical protein P3F56_03865 [cyanobacterium endosymbiont of Epithemia clementina EcSB]
MSQVNQPLCPVVICLSLATAPFLGSLLIVHQISQRLGELGEASEEVFRGDRLPILNFPDSSSTDPLS